MPRLKLALALVAALALSACDRGHAGADNLVAAKAFMATNAKADGVHILPSGLQYKIVHSGDASQPRAGANDEVKVNYEGKLLSGKVFDSSFARGVPGDFQVGGLIPGWTEALQLMRPGDEWILYVPPALGYGEQGAGGDIPPNSALIFRIQLLGVLPHPGGMRG